MSYAAKKNMPTSLQNLLNNLMVKLKAVRGPKYLGNNWILNTKAGKLEISCWPDNNLAIFCRFENVEEAKKYFPSGFSDQLNPYSGKWNFYLFPEMPEDLIRWFENELKRIL